LAGVFSTAEAKLAGDLTSVQGNLPVGGGIFDISSVAKFRELGPLLADPNIDAVDICLPTDMHAPVAIEALRAGKHALVEKPMALDPGAADCMVEEATKCGKVLMAAHVIRFWPEYEPLRGAVSEATLGSARSAILRRRCAAPAWGGWLRDTARSGGAVLDLLIHDVDMCLSLFGWPAAISAMGERDPAAGVDCLNAVLFYPDGLNVLIAGGWYPGDYPFSMEYTVTFEGGTLEYSSPSGRPPTLYRPGAPAQPLTPAARDPYSAEIEYFAE
jgi:predicted dehydrogenase